MHRVLTRSRRLGAAALGVPVGLLVCGSLVWQSSGAAFVDTTGNSSNTLTAGTVKLADDDSGNAMFAMNNLRPGDTGAKCIAVTYTGTLPAGVRIYGTFTGVANGGGTTLLPVLKVTVEEGTGGTFGSCAGFTPTTTLFATAAANTWTSTTYATGLSTWSPPGGAAVTRAYRFTYVLDAAADNTYQGAGASVTFTWEARSS